MHAGHPRQRVGPAGRALVHDQVLIGRPAGVAGHRSGAGGAHERARQREQEHAAQYGDDTIYGGPAGDVIWGDYHESGWPSHQTAIIHAGNGKNFIYSNDTVNYVWTGTNPATVVHAHEGSGAIHCENPRIVVFTSHHALPHYTLHGCRHISFFSVGY